MRTALVILVACAAIDLIATGMVLAVVWVLHRRMRKDAAARGEPIPSAAGQFGCLAAVAVIGFVLLYGIAYLLLS